MHVTYLYFHISLAEPPALLGNGPSGLGYLQHWLVVEHLYVDFMQGSASGVLRSEPASIWWIVRDIRKKTITEAMAGFIVVICSSTPESNVLYSKVSKFVLLELRETLNK